MSPTLARLVERSADTAPNIGVVYWNRLEPRPRSPEIADALGARVRDPLWILTRQWQWGEFSGEDAGSPAYVQIDSRTGSVTGWRAVGGAWQQVGTSLEQSVESEGVTADLATRIELGQRWRNDVFEPDEHDTQGSKLGQERVLPRAHSLNHHFG